MNFNTFLTPLSEASIRSCRMMLAPFGLLDRGSRTKVVHCAAFRERGFAVLVKRMDFFVDTVKRLPKEARDLCG